MTINVHKPAKKRCKGRGDGKRSFFRRITDTSGATSIEYSLMIALIAITAIAAISLLGVSMKETYKKTGDALAQLDSPGSGGSGGPGP